MLSDKLRKRLQRLNRERLEPTVESGSEKAHVAPSSQPSIPRCIAAQSKSGTVELSQIINGRVIERGDGKFLLISRRLTEFWKDANDFLSAYNKSFLNSFSEDFHKARSKNLHPDLQTFLNADPFKVLYLDIETTGLSGTPIFLTGLMYYTGFDFEIKQLFARNYAEEKYMLDYLHEFMKSFDTMVSFNGKAFDMPFIRDRAFANTIRFIHEPAHVDLLHEARRRWKYRLPNCKLQTLETFICHRRRVGDIPGDQIPQAYHDFVRTGNAYQIKKILHHNALDLITMAQIILFMFQGNDDTLDLI